jgi:hypothetical protein
VVSARTFRARRGEKEIVVEGENQAVYCVATSRDGGAAVELKPVFSECGFGIVLHRVLG